MHMSYERGAATAEYTVGTLGAVFFAVWLSRLAIGDPNHSWYGRFIHRLLNEVFGPSGVFGDHNWVWRWLM